jgi:hypothetical protein
VLFHFHTGRSAGAAKQDDGRPRRVKRWQTRVSIGDIRSGEAFGSYGWRRRIAPAAVAYVLTPNVPSCSATCRAAADNAGRRAQHRQFFPRHCLRSQRRVFASHQSRPSPTVTHSRALSRPALSREPKRNTAARAFAGKATTIRDVLLAPYRGRDQPVVDIDLSWICPRTSPVSREWDERSADPSFSQGSCAMAHGQEHGTPGTERAHILARVLCRERCPQSSSPVPIGWSP